MPAPRPRRPHRRRCRPNFDVAHSAPSGRGITRDDGSPLWDNLGQSPIDIPGNRTVKLLSFDSVIQWTPFVPVPVMNPEEIRLSAAQLQRYAEAFEDETSRPVQPLAGRTVFERVGGGR